MQAPDRRRAGRHRQAAACPLDTTDGPSATFLTLTDAATAQLGNIYIRGDRLFSGGAWMRPGMRDLYHQQRPELLVIDNFDIPPDDGGKLYFNDASISSNAQISGIQRWRQRSRIRDHHRRHRGQRQRWQHHPARNLRSSSPASTTRSIPSPRGHPAASRCWRRTSWCGEINNPRGLARDRKRRRQHPPRTGLRDPRQDGRRGMTHNGDFVQSYSNTFSHVAGEPLTFVPGDPAIHTLDRIDGPNAPEWQGHHRQRRCPAGGALPQHQRHRTGGIVDGAQIPASAKVGAQRWHRIGAQLRRAVAITRAFRCRKPRRNTEYRQRHLDDSMVPPHGVGAGDGGKLQRQENRLELAGVQVQGRVHRDLRPGLQHQPDRWRLGRLRVLDGYGQIEVDNHSGLAMVVNVLDAGRGVKGEINISDIVGIAADGTPVVATAATRDPGDARTGELLIRPAACATAGAPAR